MWLKLSLVFFGGGMGTLCRFALNLLIERQYGKMFPWGTLTVNSLGCLFFGWVWTFTEKRLIADTEWRTFLLVGFLGAFTTFSTYAFQTGQLFGSRPGLALTNIMAHNILGLSFLYLGAILGSR